MAEPTTPVAAGPVPHPATTTAPHEGPLDRVNPAIRVVAGLLLSLPLLITLDWLSASVALVLELAVTIACRLPLGRLARRLAPLLLVAPFGAISMALYGTPSGRTWWHWGPMLVTDGSLALAGATIVRILAVALPAVVLLGGIDATRMADGLAQVLRLPERFVLGSLAGLRMIGLFTQDWRALGQARRARGLGDGGRLRRWATMSFALLVLAIRRGSRLATAMEAKGFGGERRRSWARPSTVGRADAVAVAVSLAIGVVALLAAHHWGTLTTAFS